MTEPTRPADETDRVTALRAIHRLRAGLPPADRLEDITVGPPRALQALRGLMDGEASHRRWLIISGNYGHGKTHYLTLMRELAHSQRLASCQLSADGGGCALNHPHRFLPSLLSTLEMPGRICRGYEDFLHSLLDDPTKAARVQDVTQHHLRTARPLDLEVHYGLLRLRRLLSEGGEAALNEVPLRAQQIVHHLCGRSVVHRAATPGMRALAYTLLGIARDLLVGTGHGGLAIAIDEVESIYTKLPNSRSRNGAYRVLAALCESPALAGCPVTLAITPDASRALAADLAGGLGDVDALPCEPVRQWAAALSSGAVPQIACRDLRPAERVNLLDRVFILYLHAYPAALLPDRAVWHELQAQLSARDVPVRLLVRQAIDLFDSHRYHTS